MEGKALWEVSNTVGRLFAVGGAFQCTARGGGRQGFTGGGLVTGICSVLGARLSVCGGGIQATMEVLVAHGKGKENELLGLKGAN